MGHGRQQVKDDMVVHHIGLVGRDSLHVVETDDVDEVVLGDHLVFLFLRGG